MTMPDAPTWTDPWAQRQWPYLRTKVIAAGITPAELDELRVQWLHDPSWPQDEKERLIALGDTKMREEVLATRAQGLRDAETDEDERARIDMLNDAALSREMREAAQAMSAWEPHAIIEWVGGDVERARASLAVEESHPYPRPSVLTGCLAVIEANYP